MSSGILSQDIQILEISEQRKAHYNKNGTEIRVKQNRYKYQNQAEINEKHNFDLYSMAY